jgi:hypothetical protein
MVPSTPNVWLLLLRQLDLCGADGRPSFSKLITTAVLVVSVATGIFTGWLALLVICAAFGRTTLLALVNRTTAQLDPAREMEALAKLIESRRDDRLGIEVTK